MTLALSHLRPISLLLDQVDVGGQDDVLMLVLAIVEDHPNPVPSAARVVKACRTAAS